MKKSKVFYLTMSIIICIFAYLLSKNNFSGYDFLMKIKKSTVSEKNIILVNIDDLTLKRLNARWPLQRSIYTDVIKKISAGGPKVIGIDLLFTQNSKRVEDESLQKTVKKSKVPIVLAMNFNLTQNQEKLKGNDIKFQELFIDLPVIQGKLGFVNLLKDSDLVVRRAKNYINFRNKRFYSFSALLAMQIKPKTFHENLKENIFINYSIKNKPFRVISLYQILENLVPENTFKNKIVIVAPSFATMNDYHLTPISSSSQRQFAGSEIFAYTLSTLLKNQPIQKISKTFKLIILFVFFGLSVFMFLMNSLKNEIKLIIHFGFTALFILFIFILFSCFDIYLSYFSGFSYAFFGVFSFLFFVLIEYYQKVKVIQVFEKQQSEKNKNIFELYKISPREKEIIELLLQGLSNPKIGKKLFISTNTVKFHIKNIYQKTKTGSRIELVKLIEKSKAG